jgi:DNA-binding NarL/FixJ family response regulator
MNAAVGPDFEIVSSRATSHRALELEVAAILPRIVLIPAAWLRDFGLEWLGALRQFDPAPDVVVVGQQLSATTVARLIPLGFRGLVCPDIGEGDFALAIRKISAGELWLSRRLILLVMSTLAAADHSQSSSTWDNLAALTEREHAVLSEVLRGRSNKEVASTLQISEQTVKIHLQHVYQKLGVHRRTDLLLAR